jgi:Tol biopolymer transport system component
VEVSHFLCPTERRGIGRMRKCVLLLASMALAVLLAGGVALAAVEVNAVGEEKIIFVSDRTTGTGVDNPEGDHEIFTINTDGTGLQQITKNDTDESSPAVSFDGTKVAFEGPPLKGNNSSIWRMNLDGSAERRLRYGHDPAWSPNGRWITYHRRFAQQSDIYKMKAVNGLDKTNLTNTPEVFELGPAWSPDGSRIAYLRLPPTTQGDIYDMRVNGAQKTNLTDTPSFQENSIDYSPGGALIAFTDWNYAEELYKMRSDGSGEPTLILERDPSSFFNLAWSPDGTQIAFDGWTGSNSEIFKLKADGSGGLENVTKSSAEDESMGDWYRVPTG